MTRAGVFYVLAVLLGALVSWKYCGFELSCVACYYMLRALWNEMKGMLNDLKNMRWIIRLLVAEQISQIINLNL